MYLYFFSLHKDRIQHEVKNTPALETTIHDISKTPEGQIETLGKLLEKLNPSDPSSIFVVVDILQSNPNLSLNCHDIAHDLGHKAYELYGFSDAMNFTDAIRLNHASVQDVCAGGYVHGVLEEASLHESNFKTNPGGLCQNISSSKKDTCYHGIGHALMFAYERNVTLSLTGCRTIENPYISRCFEGVWMELFWGNTKYLGTDELGWNTDDPLFSCVHTDEDAKASCFLYSTFGYLKTHKKDYIGAITLCTENNLKNTDSEFCVKGVGIAMISYFKGKNLEQSEEFTDKLTFYQKYAFYQGILGYANFSGINKEELEKTCTLFKNDGDICRDVVANI